MIFLEIHSYLWKFLSVCIFGFTLKKDPCLGILFADNWTCVKDFVQKSNPLGYHICDAAHQKWGKGSAGKVNFEVFIWCIRAFSSSKMIPHSSKLIKALKFWNWKRVRILIVFFIIFWMFSSKKVHNHKACPPPFQGAASHIWNISLPPLTATK